MTADQGLGDTLKRIIEALRLHYLAKLYTRITGKPCRCEERRIWLNKRFPYTSSKFKVQSSKTNLKP